MQDEAAIRGRVGVVDPYEALLLARARDGSADAWDEIYTRHYAPIYRYIHARVFEQATAEDLTSAVFLGAVKGIRSYRYQGQPFLAWLYRIARNVVGSHQRTMFRQRSLSFGSLLGFGRAPGNAADPSDNAHDGHDPASAVESMDLREAISRLPQAQRDALLLKFYVGLDAREIAALIGKDPAAVYSLQARALESLRRHLG
jgi:RNA polymerase sigma-70 factor (ECF subfamily)